MLDRNYLPVVMLLGAKSTIDPLDSVPKEVSDIKEIIGAHGDRADLLFRLEYEPYLTQEKLQSLFDRYREQIAILHFAGHSNDHGLLSNNNIIYSRHIADMLRRWQSPPSLVFLNGCKNAAQVKYFHTGGVGVVIATRTPVGDIQAATFAQAFYKSLFTNDVSVEDAFADASSKTFFPNNIKARSLDTETMLEANGDRWDWGLFLNSDLKSTWTVKHLMTEGRPCYNEQGRLINPFRGLQAFREQDQEYFFGRESLAAELCEKITSSSLFMLLGGSGSGKSSLINAGVIPTIRSKEGWLIIKIRPSNSPFSELGRSLALKFFPQDIQSVERLEKKNELEAALWEKRIALADLLQDIKMLLGKNQILLFIDQFEELFTQSETSVAQVFLHHLTNLIEERLPDCHLLLVMRADFLPAVLENARFTKLLDEYPSKFLAAMGSAELRAAIEKPANKQLVEVELSLTEALLDSVKNQPGSLPLLQYVLSLLWERRQSGLIKLEDYNLLGGLEKALETRANSIFERLTASQQESSKGIFLRLIQPGDGADDTRRRANLSEFGDSPEVQDLIQSLADERLITTKNEGKESEGYIEVAHEALIKNWPRLTHWIGENREEIRIRSRFTEAAKSWDDDGRENSLDYVYRGSLLTSIEELVNDSKIGLNSLEQDFLKVSLHIRNIQREEEDERKSLELKQAKALIREQEESAKKQRRLFIVSGFFIMVLGLVSGLTFEYFQEAKKTSLQLEDIERRNAHERTRTDIKGELTVFSTQYGDLTKESYINRKKRGLFTSVFEKYLFKKHTSANEAVSLAVEEMQEQGQQQPEVLSSLNGKIFINPAIKDRKFYSLIFGWDYSKSDTNIPQLRGTINDVNSIHTNLKRLGYDSNVFINLTQNELISVLMRFLDGLNKECQLDRGTISYFKKVSLDLMPDEPEPEVCENTVVFLYFSGHGMARGGITYLVTSDYGSESHSRISIEQIRSMMRKKIPVRIIISDIGRGDSEYSFKRKQHNLR